MDEKLFQEPCNPWKEVLVIKLFGKNMDYLLMKDRLKKMWKLNEGFDIMDINNDFVSPLAKVEKTMVWIRFPWLNLLYYDENVLFGLTSVMGTPIKVDDNTLNIEGKVFKNLRGD
ncbi:hypothetical protein KIW84_044226 [Lathyrus oleraceus]|uniref:DUF4283 domain-containing protein n=1 Tax=Pisum sativum TaxID=3888 RepID=A0A9D5AVL9_PEA|nr:hypothetical protein KIW84_044226 [Pisum sativum]